MSLVPYQGFQIETRPDVYDPSDDTYLLARAAADLDGLNVLEIGCGAGLVSVVAAASGARVLASDLNPSAVRLTRRNAQRNDVHVEVVQTDLMRGVRPTALDRILINPPYLPTSEFEAVPGPLNLAFDAGPDGRRFLPRLAAYLQEARPRLRAGFEAFVVVSSLQGLAWATALWRRHGFAAQSHAQQAMPFETLHLLKVTPMQP